MPLLALLAAPQNPPALRNPIRLLAPSQQREEAELIRMAIESIHPDPARFQSKGGLSAQGRELVREADFAGDSATWYRAVSRYLAAIRCDQTKAEWPAAVLKWRDENRTYLPFRIALVGKRAIVTHVPKESDIKPGDELLEIEGRRIDDVRREIARWTSVDGRTDFAKDVKFGDDADLSGSGLENFGPILWGIRTTWRIRLRQGGAKEAIGIDTKDWRTLAFRPDFKDAVRYERREDGVAVLRVSSFSNSRERVDPVETFRVHFATLKRDLATRLVLDLRSCSGGSEEVPIALLRYLCPQPITWASEIWTKAPEVPEILRPYLNASNASLEKPDMTRFERRPEGAFRLLPEANPLLLRPQDPLPEHYGGPLDVLVGPANSRAATHFLVRLRASRPVRIIGQRTGGTTEGTNGEPFWFLRLPFSGITVRIPTYRTETGVKSRPGHGIEPDVVKGPTADDVAGNTDSVLAWAVENEPKAWSQKKS